MDGRERQAAYRDRMYAAGYKQIRLWVPRNAEEKPVKMERLAFIKLLDELTLGWNKTKLRRFLADLAKILITKAKGVKKRK
ncbi:MAG: antitoxin MazE family protein [Treponema sp.]|jgi:hypothetical protein|nr:antitoxin MazE family protein [Treponema sp.]